MSNIYIEEKEIRRILQIVKPGGKYYLQDVVDKNLVPGVFTYEQAFSMTHDVVKYAENATGRKHIPAEKTTENKIRVYSEGRPGRLISGKLFIVGEDIIQFLKLNNLIKAEWFGA